MTTPAARAAVRGKSKRSRKPNPKLAKIHLVYDVRQIAAIFQVHLNTVFAWIEAGLPTTDDGRPILVHGSDLREFLERKRSKVSPRLANGEFRCMKCRTNRRPAGDMADLECQSSELGNLVGICPACESIMNRRVNLRDLGEVSAGLDVCVREASGT